ncbi:hypothetical protein [Micromonospora siamensis]|uniref:Lipoprotein n=1 Tax=Micromonospora siamensis TaxID=299152 RepID=A0A1C5H0R6_9ACTN|nr:hypothetical protein [Micromonospora siamensis]SCG39604.1 hypothetical protein GA0074704_0847 [Micromonospora siamensis]
MLNLVQRRSIAVAAVVVVAACGSSATPATDVALPTGSATAVADLRTLVARCPSVLVSDGAGGFVSRYAIAPGPRLGDESVHGRQSSGTGPDTMRWDCLPVRVGTDLVAIQEEGNKPGGDELLVQLADAAVTRHRTTAS